MQFYRSCLYAYQEPCHWRDAAYTGSIHRLAVYPCWALPSSAAPHML